jgi:spore coat protein SA
LKVAQVNQPLTAIEPPGHTGSISIWIYEIARQLSQRCNVTVYTIAGGSQQPRERVDEIEYRRFPPPSPGRLSKLIERVQRKVATPKRPFFISHWYSQGYFRAVARDLRQQSYDIVHIHNFSQFALAARQACPSAKIVLTMQCEWLTQIDRAVIARHLRAVDAVIGCSDYITEGIRRAFPWIADRCYTVHNGADLSMFGPRASGNSNGHRSAKNIVFAGRMSPEKGVHVLIQAFAQLADREPEARLEVIGPCAVPEPAFILRLSTDPEVARMAPLWGYHYRDDLKGRLPAQLADRVSFPGPIAHDQLPDRYCKAAMFVHPSVWDEPFAISVLEAMAAGLPVVATRTGGTPELVEDGVNGLLVERNDPRALAEAMLRLLRDEALCKKLGNAARQSMTNQFSWERAAGSLFGIYQKLL